MTVHSTMTMCKLDLDLADGMLREANTQRYLLIVPYILKP